MVRPAVLAVLAVCVLASSATVTPNMKFQLPFYSKTLPNAIYVDPSGVFGEASPLVVGNTMETVHSFSPSGASLGNFTSSVFQEPYFPGASPVIGRDANGDSLYITTVRNASVFALYSKSLEQKWSYMPPKHCATDFCSVLGLVLLNAASAPQGCTSGAGAVSFQVCHAKTNVSTQKLCILQILDVDTGAACTIPKQLPDGDYIDDTYLVIPQTSSSTSVPPVVITAQDHTNTLLCFDARDGTVMYKIPLNTSMVDTFAQGTSPDNAHFAYYTGDNTIFIRRIIDGAITVQASPTFLFGDFETPSWTSSTSFPDGAITMGGENFVETHDLLTFSAKNGELLLHQKMEGPAGQRFAGVSAADMLWIITKDGDNAPYVLSGFSTTTDGAATVRLNLPSVLPVSYNAPIVTFEFSDGTPGLATLVWGSDGSAFLNVFELK